MQESSRSQANSLPERSGVYLMKSDDGTIIYVGKARNLKKRVVTYFNGTKDRKTRALVRQVDRIDYITTRNEFEALLLENSLIKEWQPRYNINLKDGKSYPVIRITNEEFPRVFRTRRFVDDGSDYFGPFPNVATLDIYLDLIEKLYPLRKCRGSLKRRDHPCLYHHIHRCSAPCVGLASAAEYGENVDAIRAMLTGSVTDVKKELQERMERESEALRFERAAELRDASEALERVARQQDVVDFDGENRDYLGVLERDGACCFVVFQMRTGRLIGRDLFFGVKYTSMEEAIGQYVLQYYAEKQLLPAKLFVPGDANLVLIQRYFDERPPTNGADREASSKTESARPLDDRADMTDDEPRSTDSSVDAVQEEPARGATIVLVASSPSDVSLAKLARENALEELLRNQKGDRVVAGLEELRLVLSLPQVPARIEGFDISHLGGTHTVASLVVFTDGRPDKSDYRKFHVRSLEGRIDDFESMREVVARRYTRVVNEKTKRPDLVLVDGGRGQVSTARSVLDALGLDNVPIAGLAKREEEIFVPNQSQPIRLPEGSGALKILQQVRDESHRFATTFNKQLRKKDVKLSTLEEVEGIGPKRAATLIKAFVSLDSIGEADAEKIATSAHITTKAAEAVLNHIKSVTVSQQ